MHMWSSVAFVENEHPVYRNLKVRSKNLYLSHPVYFLGTVGYVGTGFFVHKIYSTVKID